MQRTVLIVACLLCSALQVAATPNDVLGVQIAGGIGNALAWTTFYNGYTGVTGGSLTTSSTVPAITPSDYGLLLVNFNSFLSATITNNIVNYYNAGGVVVLVNDGCCNDGAEANAVLTALGSPVRVLAGTQGGTCTTTTLVSSHCFMTGISVVGYGYFDRVIGGQTLFSGHEAVAPNNAVAQADPSDRLVVIGDSNFFHFCNNGAEATFGANLATCATSCSDATTAPTISGCQSPTITLNTNSGVCCATHSFSTPTGADADSCAVLTGPTRSGRASGSCFVDAESVSYTVTDSAGQSASCSWTYDINDNQAPRIDGSLSSTACPSNIATNTAAGTCGAAVSYTTPVGTDNCPGVSTARTAGQASGSVFPLGTTGQTFTATDSTGLTASCSFSVTVNDGEAPVIDGSSGSTACPSNIAVNNDAGVCSAGVNFINPIGADNCPGVSTLQTAGLASGSAFPVGSTSQTFTATDAAGLTNTCSFSVTVSDAESPRIDGSLGSTPCPSNIGASTAAGVCTANVAYTSPVGSDNCPGVSTSRTAGLASGSVFPLGSTTQTFTATDAAGLVSSCSFSVSVSDAESPRIDGTLGSTPCPSNIGASTDAGVCTANVAYTPPVGTDNCPGVSTALTAGLASGAAFPLGPTSQTYTATDAGGRASTCSFSVTVSDGEAPAIDGSAGSTACPANIAVNSDAGVCTAAVSFTNPVGTDNCPGVSTLQTAGLASGSAFPLGSTGQTFTATDAAGQTSSCSFAVTVSDGEAPVIDGSAGSTACPSNIAVNNDVGVCTAVVPFTNPLGTDNCPGVTTVQTSGLASGSAFPVGATGQTFTATDAAGLTNSCSFSVSVSDAESPRIDGTLGSTPCPSNIGASTDAGVCTANVAYTPPVGTDNCPGVSTALTAGLASGAAFPLGPTSQTYTATDAGGRASTCSFSVTVSDGEAPAIDGSAGSTACPANIAVNSDAGVCTAAVSFTNPVGTDNCPGVSTLQTAGLASGSAFPLGSTGQTFTATDAAGQASSCSFSVLVSDAEAPVIDGSNGSVSCPSNIARNNDPGQCDAVVSFVSPSGTDNCPGVSTALLSGLASGSSFPVGTTSQTYRATDAGSLTADCSFSVTVTDAEGPFLDGTVGSTTCPANIAMTNDVGQCNAVVSFTVPVGTDNCPGVTTAQTAGLGSGAAFPVGTTSQTFVATDASSRTDSCSFSVTVTDAEGPFLDGSLGSTPCPANIVTTSDPGVCTAAVSFTAPVGADNCPGVSTVQTAGLASGSAFPIGATGQTFEATDAAGRLDTCSFSVTVSDAEVPSIDGSSGSTACPASIAANTDPGVCTAAVAFTPPVGTDNCPGVSTARTSGLGSGSMFPLGTTLQTYTATDAGGLTNSCSFSVIVSDAEAPHIDGNLGSTPCPAAVTINNDAGHCSAVVSFVEPVGADNCAGVTTSQTTGLPSGSVFPVGSTSQAFQAEDAGGLTASCSFSVNVVDAENPVASHSPSGIVTAFIDEPYGYTVSAADNCAGVTATHVSGPLATDSSPSATAPENVTYRIDDANGNSILYVFQVQTISGVSGILSPSYMYIPMEVTLSNGLFPSGDTHAWVELWTGSTAMHFATPRLPLSTSMTFEGVSETMPGVYDYWLIAHPSGTRRFIDSIQLCASHYNCPRL